MDNESWKEKEKKEDVNIVLKMEIRHGRAIILIKVDTVTLKRKVRRRKHNLAIQTNQSQNEDFSATVHNWHGEFQMLKLVFKITVTCLH